jgi:cobalamin-dependent methionine synthase I
MPLIHDLPVSLSVDEVKAIPGLRSRGAMHKRVQILLPEILNEIETANLIQPAIVYEVVEIKAKGDREVVLNDNSRLLSPLVAHRLKRASRLVFAVATIGKTIDTFITDLFSSGKHLKALVTEELTNACLHKVSIQIQQRIDTEASRLQLQASGFLAPGDEGFPIGQQRHVLRLAGARQINITLSETSMMTPRHSVSKVIGLGRHMRKWTQVESCAECASRDRCPHRQTVAVMAR